MLPVQKSAILRSGVVQFAAMLVVNHNRKVPSQHVAIRDDHVVVGAERPMVFRPNAAR